MQKIKANDYKPEEMVKFIREWAELTQKDFAKSIDRQESTIADYEHGRIKFSYDIFLKMCKKHNIDVILYKK